MAEFSIRAVTFLPGGGLEGGKAEMPAVGAVIGLGVGAGGAASFPSADAYMSGLSAMASAELL